jgi:hypothetical protein
MYPVHAQLTVAKQLMNAGDFNANLLPAITQWTPGTGASFDNATIKLTNTGAQQCLAYYSYTLNQNIAKPVRITGESYSQGITVVSPSLSYSLRVDITYNDNSTELYRCVPFTGNSSWESKDFIFCPQKPIQRVLVVVMLYNYSGTAWFKNITLQVKADGGSSSFGKFGNTAVFNQTTTEGYLVRQFTAAENWYEIANGQTGRNWSLDASSSTNNGFTTHTATITNTSGNSRAGILAYRIPLTGSNFKWCSTDLRTQLSMNSLDVEYSDRITSNINANEIAGNTNAKSSSKFLWGCVVNDINGYAIAVDPDYPCQFKISYNACNQEFFVVFDLGFTASGSVKDNATVKFVTWMFNPASGMRQAIHDFYKLYPNAFRDRITEKGGEHGIWWYLKDLSGNSINNIKDFGFKIDQQPPNGAIAYDDANDLLSIFYVAPWELRIYGADLPGWPHPAYADVVQKLTDLYNSSDPAAIAVVNSASKDSSGRYIYLTTAEWSPNHIRFQCNPAPGIRPNIYGANTPSERNAYYDQWRNSSFQDLLTAPNTWDGMICDNVTDGYLSLCDEKTPIDYDSSHFNHMTTPLIHDINGVVGIGLEMMIWEYFTGVRQDMDNLMAGDNRLRIMQANGSPPPFAGCKLDVQGGEQVWDVNNNWSPRTEATMLEYRMKAGRKPVVFLQNPYEHSLGTGSNWMTNARTQKYIARCCAFGIMPSLGITDGGNSTGLTYFSNSTFFETANPNTTPANMSDRNLFQKYIPVIRKLSQTGWEPVRQATVSDSDVFLERFGAEYITIFNPTANSKSITVTYLPAAISMTGKELISDSSVTWTSGQTTLTVGSECVAVIEIPSLLDFKFDEGTGASVAATAPYAGITGTTSNTSWVNGVDGQSTHALSFDGSASYINIPSNNLFAASDVGITFSAWVKPGSITPNNYNMVLTHGNSHYLSLYNGCVMFKILTEDGVSHWCYTSATLTVNTWYHIAGSYDREGNMKVFINGRQNGSTAGPFLNPDSNANSLTIGKYNSYSLYYFNGIIDDVQICRKGSTDKEIRKLKDKAIIAYSLPLNEGTGTTAYDDFDSSRQATITGAAWHGNTTLDKKDNALYFDGVNDYVTITGSSTAFRTDGSNGFTFAAWIKSDGAFPTGHDPVISKGNTYLSIYNGKLGFKTLTDYPTNNQRWCAGSTTLTSGVWHHVAAVYEANGNIKVYLDGLQNGSTVGPYPNQVNETSNIQLAGCRAEKNMVHY